MALGPSHLLPGLNLPLAIVPWPQCPSSNFLIPSPYHSHPTHLAPISVPRPSLVLNPPYTVKVTLLVSGEGNQVAGFHTCLDGGGGLLQAAAPLLAVLWLRAFLWWERG